MFPRETPRFGSFQLVSGGLHDPPVGYEVVELFDVEHQTMRKGEMSGNEVTKVVWLGSEDRGQLVGAKQAGSNLMENADALTGSTGRIT